MPTADICNYSMKQGFYGHMPIYLNAGLTTNVIALSTEIIEGYL